MVYALSLVKARIFVCFLYLQLWLVVYKILQLLPLYNVWSYVLLKGIHSYICTIYKLLANLVWECLLKFSLGSLLLFSFSFKFYLYFFIFLTWVWFFLLMIMFLQKFIFWTFLWKMYILLFLFFHFTWVAYVARKYTF